ncbi:hypothetical protein [Paenibacillus sp. 1P07SE]|uniref:hypothetical protein n=1 Tax=Paenibacillus sp. 1P07SE TaxID=3132209 RepID=UPI0039A4C843
MRSEYQVELCFIRTGQPEAAFPELEARVQRLFAGVLRCAAERRQREGLDIATVRLSGRHTRWSDEQELVDHLERAVRSGELEDLYGYQVRLEQLEDMAADEAERRVVR